MFILKSHKIKSKFHRFYWFIIVFGSHLSTASISSPSHHQIINYDHDDILIKLVKILNIFGTNFWYGIKLKLGYKINNAENRLALCRFEFDNDLKLRFLPHHQSSSLTRRENTKLERTKFNVAWSKHFKKYSSKISTRRFRSCLSVFSR